MPELVGEMASEPDPIPLYPFRRDEEAVHSIPLPKQALPRKGRPDYSTPAGGGPPLFKLGACSLGLSSGIIGDMRIGAFKLQDPLPEMREPHVLAVLSPWIDVGSVGSGVLSLLEARLQAQPLGGLEKPGAFYDFTRYRPMLVRREGRREIRIPNTLVSHGRGEGGPDFLFLRCLEPHIFGETYVESVLRLMEELKAKSYCLLGGMYDAVPHTRPILVTGGASDPRTQSLLGELMVSSSNYQGPTTINTLISEEAPKRGIDTLSLIAHLPHYAQLEEDYRGQLVILDLLCHLYLLPIELGDLKKQGEEQYRELGRAIESDHRLREMVRLVEDNYDARKEREQREEAAPPLPPEIEKFLREIDKGFSSN